MCGICGMVGALVVGNRMAFFSDAMAHCAFAGTPPRESRGDADENSTVHAARNHSNVPLLTRKGGTPDCAEGVVQKHLDRATAPEIAPPDDSRDEGGAPR